ncbi:hypothetical protein BHE74_00014267, partial [Ensete ventricosum]
VRRIINSKIFHTDLYLPYRAVCTSPLGYRYADRPLPGGVTREWVGEGELPKERTQSEVAEALRCMIGATRELDYFSAYICLREPGKLEDKAEEHRGVKAGGRKGRGSNDESRRAQLPKKQSVSQKGGGLGGVPQCRRGGSTDRGKKDTDARQRIVGHGLGSTMVPQMRDFRGVIDPLLSWRESVGRERGRGGGECKGKL